MNTPRRAQDASDQIESGIPAAFDAAPRRAMKTKAELVRTRVAPVAVSLTMLATAGGFALNLKANETETTAAVPAPVREDAPTRSETRSLVEEAPKADAAASSAAMVGGSWAESFDKVIGEKYVQRPAIVRASASQESAQLDRLTPGAKVSVTGKVENEYRQISLNGKLAWISDARLGDAAPVEEAPKPAPVKAEAPKAEVKQETPKQADAPKKAEAPKAEPKKAEAKKAEVKKAESKKAEAKKAEPKKAEAKKAEPKKAEKKQAASSEKYNGPTQHSGKTVLGLHPKAMVVYNAVTSKWSFSSIGGYRATNNRSNHGRGGAIDFMVKPGAESAKGWAVANYLASNMDALGIDHIIFEQKIYTSYNRYWRPMANRGSTTANHYDHVHVSVKGV